MPSLFVIQGRDQGTRFELEEERSLIGRVGANAVQLHDTEVSRQHAEIIREGETCTIVDLNSSNGTFVGGKPVKRRQLRTGDQVQMGRTLMLFTGALGDALADDQQVDIIAGRGEADGSRIVQAMSQAEGSELLALPADQTQSPWLARARSNLQIMYRTALAVSHTLDIDQLLSRIMDMIFEWVDADRGCIMLKDDQTGQLKPRVRRHRRGVRESDSQHVFDGDSDGGGGPGDRIAISKTILDYVVERRQGVLTSNARDDDRWNPAQSIVKLGVREAICVPMQGRYDLVGVIYIDTSLTSKQVLEKRGANKFGEEHLKLMIAIAHQAALAVEDTSYYQAMVQAERLAAVGQTIASLSHHIKNILQGVRGGSYLIEMGMQQYDQARGAGRAGAAEDATPGDTQHQAAQAPNAGPVDAAAAVETMRKGWAIVEKNQQRISGLVMDMLSYSKERQPEPADASLNDVAGEVVQMLGARASDAGVTLRWRPAADLPMMRFDPEALNRAILNVLTNAIDACHEMLQAHRAETPAAAAGPAREAVVTVSTCLDSGRKRAAVAVEDTGLGIPAEDLDRIFTVFVSNKGGRGTGLGLAVTRKILQEHGGAVSVTSKVGRGSRFVLELPLADAKAASRDAGPASANETPAEPGAGPAAGPPNEGRSDTLVNPTVR